MLGKKAKRNLLIAGGAGALLLVTGVVVAVSKKASASTPAPTASDADVAKVADAALVKESDPAVLRALASAMLVFPYSNPLRNKVGALQARAAELELARQTVQNNGSSTARLGDFV